MKTTRLDPLQLIRKSRQRADELSASDHDTATLLNEMADMVSRTNDYTPRDFSTELLEKLDGLAETTRRQVAFFRTKEVRGTVMKGMAEEVKSQGQVLEDAAFEIRRLACNCDALIDLCVYYDHKTAAWHAASPKGSADNPDNPVGGWTNKDSAASALIAKGKANP